MRSGHPIEEGWPGTDKTHLSLENLNPQLCATLSWVDQSAIPRSLSETSRRIDTLYILHARFFAALNIKLLLIWTLRL